MSWLAKNPEVVYTDLEDGAVLLDMGSGFYYSLDAVGTAVWRLVEAAGSADELASALAERFEVDADRARDVAAGFIDELRAERLVVPADDAGETALAEAREPVHVGGAVDGERRPFREPELVKHEEPLSRMSMHPFDPQLPLAE